MKSLNILFAFSLIIVSTNADTLSTESNDYYMIPPVSNSSSVASPQSSAPIEQCWYEQVPISGASQNDTTPNVAGAVVGGIIGGIVGHQFGSGSGNTAATIGGAAIGTAIGANSGNNPTTPQYQLIRKCNTIR
jgi:uncharacterized protein YcfJ